MGGQEKPAVLTTIVGGRPPGCGCDLSQTPRGMEVLLKKAAVDPAFRAALLARRAGAAEEIGLTLAPAEAAMLAAIPAVQLESIIEKTEVPDESRRAFLGQMGVAMLAALGLVGATGCPEVPSRGHRSSRPARQKLAVMPAESTPEPTVQSGDRSTSDSTATSATSD